GRRPDRVHEPARRPHRQACRPPLRSLHGACCRQERLQGTVCVRGRADARRRDAVRPDLPGARGRHRARHGDGWDRQLRERSRHAAIPADEDGRRRHHHVRGVSTPVSTDQHYAEVSMSASAVAVPSPQNRGGLALLLAVLGVPGVTIAWDLPAGGYWIGIPLALAAIVVGTRARGTSPRLATPAIVLAAIEILFTATW